MAFVALTAAEVDPNSPGDQALMDKIRLNFDDHESRILAASTARSDEIFTHFFAAGLDTNMFLLGAGTATFSLATSNDHQIDLTPPGAHIGFGSATNKMHFRLGVDMALFMEWRNKLSIPSNQPTDLFVGFQDASLALTATTCITDISDCIGFKKAAAGADWTFRTAKAGTATETANVASYAAWRKMRLELTKAGATLQVKALVDGVEISGSPFTANIPDTVTLRPVWGGVKNIDSYDHLIDYIDGRWTSVTVLA